MATLIGKIHCVICGKEKVAYKCEGCSKSFCFNHLADHRHILDQQLDEVEHKRNLFRQKLTEKTTNIQKPSLIQQINKWEKDSIKIIEQTANEARELLVQYNNQHINRIEIKLTELTKELKHIRQENDFNEIHLDQFNKKLKQLTEELDKPSNISIQEDSSSFVTKISVTISPDFTNFNINSKWIQNGITVAGGNESGNRLNQLSLPWGVYIDDDQTIYVADTDNHRIVKWKSGATSGQVVAGGNGLGNRNEQLNGPRNVIVDKENDCLIISDRENRRVVRWPRRNGTSGETIISNIDCYGLTMDDNEYLYASDANKHEVRRWKIGDTNGTVVAGGNGFGDRLDQLNYPYYIFIDQDHSVYVSDCGNHRVMKWMKDAKEGIVVAGGQGQGNSLTQLSNPLGVFVDQLGTVYVADQNNHRVMRWLKGATEGSVVVGGNGRGGQPNQFTYPMDLSFDQQKNLYLLDYWNNRVQKFDINLN